MQNFTVNECGPVHITMGDGGNIEGLSKLPFFNSPMHRMLTSCFLSAFDLALDLAAVWHPTKPSFPGYLCGFVRHMHQLRCK